MTDRNIYQNFNLLTKSYEVRINSSRQFTMKKFLFLVLLAFVSISFGQRPNINGLYDNGTPWPDGGEVPGSPDYCSTAETIEDCTNSWVWNSNFQDCIQPGYQFCEALFGTVWILDTWECCCETASTPDWPGSWTGFEGSVCEEYMNSLSIEDNKIPINGVYIDIFGRTYITQPKGLSIMNNKKYYKF